MFQDSEFTAACQELNKPDMDSEGYEFFTETHDQSYDVTIYRLYNEVSGLYSYKIYGALHDVPPELCIAVYMDLEYRKEWDSYVKELYEKEVGGKKLIYWHVKFPFPMSNRDYVYARELREIQEGDNNKCYILLAKSQECADYPENSGVIRVDDYLSHIAIKSDGNGGCKAYMKYYDNPKGSIPTWLINWAAKTGVPGFLTETYKACKGYDEYRQQQPQESS
ncbi:hypothetical protein ScPMuIL_012871 [Solemya velum]